MGRALARRGARHVQNAINDSICGFGLLCSVLGGGCGLAARCATLARRGARHAQNAINNGILWLLSSVLCAWLSERGLFLSERGVFLSEQGLFLSERGLFPLERGLLLSARGLFLSERGPLF